MYRPAPSASRRMSCTPSRHAEQQQESHDQPMTEAMAATASRRPCRDQVSGQIENCWLLELRNRARPAAIRPSHPPCRPRIRDAAAPPGAACHSAFPAWQRRAAGPAREWRVHRMPDAVRTLRLTARIGPAGLNLKSDPPRLRPRIGIQAAGSSKGVQGWETIRISSGNGATLRRRKAEVSASR